MDIQRDVPKTWDDLTPYQKNIGQKLMNGVAITDVNEQTVLQLGTTLTFTNNVADPKMTEDQVVTLFQNLYWLAHQQRGDKIALSTPFATPNAAMNKLSGVPNIDAVVALNKYTDYHDVTVAADGTTTYTQSSLSKGIASKASEMRQKTMQLHDGLQQTDNAYYGDSELIMSTTAYASICFTVIATSLLYVIFVEL